MIPSKTHIWMRDTSWSPATQASDESKNVAGLQLHTLQAHPLHTPPGDPQPPRTHSQNHNTQSRTNEVDPTIIPGGRALTSPFPHDPYVGLPVIGNGLTGMIFDMGQGRVVKKAKQYQPGHLKDREDMEYMNHINQETLENEIQVFKRLGNYKGIIPYFQTSLYGIELALAQGDLESYIDSHQESEASLKTSWMSSIIETFVYVHSNKVFVDDIALRNILILDEQLKLADFGQSILLPLDIDIAAANENDLTVQIEILHLGWILYSIASWQVHKYYFFSSENPDLRWPEPDSFPNVENVLCGEIIEKCWRGEYASMATVKDEALQLLTGH